MTNPTIYTTSSSSSSSTSQYSSEPRAFRADPVTEYARILYEHTRQQMDNAAQQQQDKASSRDIQSHRQHSHLDNSRATARA